MQVLFFFAHFYFACPLLVKFVVGYFEKFVGFGQKK